MQSKKTNIFDIFNYIFLFLLSLLFVYPIIMTLSVSFSDPKALITDNVILLPKGFTMEAYKLLLSDGRILRYYLNTIVYAALGTSVMLLFTSMMAFPLTYGEFRGKKLITVILLVTMFFGGGLIPYYLLIKQLGMIDKIWVMIIPGAVSAWNVIIFKTFFLGIPLSLRESAYIDGAGHFRVLFSIIIPLSKALIATFTLFSVVGYWNDWFTAFLFLNSDNKMPIQLFLRRMLVLMEYTDSKNAEILRSLQNTNPRTVKCAAVIITITPILCVYPFLQKYFTKGILVGSIKA
ncbi:MAG: carbohydrate ABC transporter permease [Clostridiaceae bacterium]